MKRVLSQLFVWLSIIVLGATVLPVLADNTLDDERLLKAVFIFNFAKLTQWPKNTWQHRDDPFNLCIAGSDQLASDLRYLSGKNIKARPVVIKPSINQQDMATCHLLYVASSEQEQYEGILAALDNQPILTVSSISGFVKNGGIIELYTENNRTRFLIHQRNSKTKGLQISSRLLSLANVIGQEEIP
ncbi:MAG: YfiR family protein [Gammaproteobacteria bacterium]|nr:YfiR family protein [Gammaproteobacteria bacterium]